MGFLGLAVASAPNDMQRQEKEIKNIEIESTGFFNGITQLFASLANGQHIEADNSS